MCMGGAPSAPAVAPLPPAPPPPPTPVDPAVLAARQNASDSARQAAGRASTILTSPQGTLDSDSDLQNKRKTLLGA